MSQHPALPVRSRSVIRALAVPAAILLALACRDHQGGSPPAAPPPSTATILRVDPLEGPVGTPVFLTVTGLQGTPSVAFGATAAMVQVLDGDRLLAIVPDGAHSGPVKVSGASATATAAVPFTVSPPSADAPAFTFDPPAADEGAKVTLTGPGLGAAQKVLIGDAEALWTPGGSGLVATVPAGARPFRPILVQTPGGTFSSGARLLVQTAQAPGVVPKSMTPQSGVVGDPVTLRFDSIQQCSAVYFGTTPAATTTDLPYDGQTDTFGVRAVVPPGAQSGPVRIVFDDGSVVFPDPFTVRTPPPAVTRIDPARGAPGTVVVITGSSFDRGLTVRFGATPATLLSPPTAGTALVRVPAGAASGPITLGNPGGEAVSAPFTVTAASSALDLSIASLWITQATQGEDGHVPLVQGRDGFLRVRVRANALNTARPVVRVHLTDAAGAEVLGADLPAPQANAPTGFREGVLDSTWNLALAGKYLQPGYAVRAEVDPGGAVPEADRGNNRFPLDGSSLPLDVRPVAPFRITLYPVYQQERLGNVDGGGRSLASWLDPLRRMYPVAELDVRKGGAVSTDLDMNDDSNLYWLRKDLEKKRLAEGTGLDRIHYGVLDVSYAEGTNGEGVVAQQGTLQAGAAVGWDKGDYTREKGYYNYNEILAHEVGHLMGRRHSPAGGAGGADRAYPYADGGIGVYGFDLDSRTLLDPAGTYDLMGYRSPRWISDWTYQGILAFRAAAPAPDAGPAQDCLLVSGDVTGFSFDGQARLEPAFTLPTRPLAPVPSYFTLECLDGTGAVLLSVPFGGRPRSQEGDFRYPFSFTVPFPAAQAAALRGLRITRGAEVVWTKTVPDPGPYSDPVAKATVTGVVRLTWDNGIHPGVMVWDPRTREVLGIGTSGTLDLATDAPELDLMLSDGVRSVNRRVTVH